MDRLIKIGDYPIHHDNKVHVHRVRRKKCPYCMFVDESGNPKLEGSPLLQNNLCKISITPNGFLKVIINNEETQTRITCCPKCERKLWFNV